MKKVFNKTEEDFKNDLEAYKNYEEEVEDIIYNIVHGINVSKMEEKIEKYSQENAKLITLKVSELQKRSREVVDQIEKEEEKRQKREAEFRVSLISSIFPAYLQVSLGFIAAGALVKE